MLIALLDNKVERSAKTLFLPKFQQQIRRRQAQLEEDVPFFPDRISKIIQF